MTAFERSQDKSVFIRAGRTAFLIGVLGGNNPYTEKPYSDLWAKGFREAKKEFDDKKMRERQQRGATGRPPRKEKPRARGR